MSSIPFPILFLFLLFCTMWFLLRAHQRKEAAKRKLPQREAYLAAHALAAPACHACGATELKDEGLNSGADARRIVSCTKCGQLLFQFTQDAA